MTDPDQIAYHVCYGPRRSTIADLAWIAGSRWRIEECFQQAKNEAGLDHYQVRSWPSSRRSPDVNARELTLRRLRTAPSNTDTDHGGKVCRDACITGVTAHHPARPKAVTTSNHVNSLSTWNTGAGTSLPDPGSEHAGPGGGCGGSGVARSRSRLAQGRGRVIVVEGFQRGKVRRISVQIEYPDGSTRILDIPAPEQVSALVFDETAVLETDLSAFDVSESQWRRNPAMLIYTRDATASGIPFGAHDDRRS